VKLVNGEKASLLYLGIMLPPAVMLFFLANLVGAHLMGMFAGVLLPAGLLVVAYARVLSTRLRGRSRSSRVGRRAG
jgi:TRAP-type mannitol/chloroaromatic compound transport system permease large subunit